LFTIENNATTGAGAVSVTVADNVIKVSGSVAAGQTANQRICTPVPGSLAQEALLYAVQLRGIVVAGGEVNPTPVKEIAKHESVPLREIITPMLKESDNHIAEQLRATMLARCRTELPLRFRSWALLTGATEPPATPDNTRQWVDGSGLSRENSFSPARLEEYLLATDNKQLLRDALPVAGLDGTLATRMADTCAQGVVCAKTGTMTGVCNIAGVTKTKSGETIVFVIMTSGYAGTSAPVKKMQDALLVWLTEQ
ncbi:MAG: D-alanyl-D-alanine carboxypeptidase/D-alanyl-D-alanine-endopeptidase, partial [bacterium]